MAWVDDHIFAAGGDHLPQRWLAFTEQYGTAAVLHLDPERPAVFSGPAPPAFLWLNVSREADAGVEARWLAGHFLCTCIDAGGSVLLHSSLGRHRTRWAYVAFLLCRGRSLAAALRQVEAPPWLAPYRTDLEKWREFVESLEARSSRASDGLASPEVE